MVHYTLILSMGILAFSMIAVPFFVQTKIFLIQIESRWLRYAE